MMHLITGGSASGKSSYAEDMALETGRKNRIYLATMQPYGEEGRSRVEKHRAMRAGKGFRTIECYDHLEQINLYDAAPLIPDVREMFPANDDNRPEHTVILLECISNLTANEQFGAGGTDDEIISRILNGIEAIKHYHRIRLLSRMKYFRMEFRTTRTRCAISESLAESIRNWRGRRIG